MKKLISIFLCVMLMLTMLAACAKTETGTDAAAGTAPQTENAAEQSGDTAAAQTTIVWQSWDSYSKYEAAIQAFEQAYPEIHVEYEQVSDYMTKIMTEATSDELPDLISCKSGYTPIFADAGILQALDVSALQADAEYDYADFWETTYDYCTYDGTYYALPIDGGGYAWVYNEQMFDKLGITVPENGFTWTQFREVCQTLVDHKDELGISYPTLINDYGFRTIYPWAIQNGAEYLNADNTACLLNSEQTLGAIEYLQTLIADGYMLPMEKLDEGTYPIVGMLNSGEIAMGRIALWETTALEDSENVTWQVMHSPCADNGKQAEILYINTIAISASSKNQEAAQTFIKYITGKEGLSILLKGTSDPQTSVRKSLQELSISMFTEDKNMHIYNDAVEYSTWIPNLVSYEDQLTFMQQKLDEIWYNNAEPAAVLTEIESGINDILQE